MVERICCVSTWCWCWSRLPKDDWCFTRRRSRKCVHNLSTQQKHTQTYLTFVSSPASLAPVIIFKQNIPQNRWLNLTKWPIDVVLPGSGAQNLSNLPRIMRCQRLLSFLHFLYISSGWEASLQTCQFYQSQSGSKSLVALQRPSYSCRASPAKAKGFESSLHLSWSL